MDLLLVLVQVVLGVVKTVPLVVVDTEGVLGTVLMLQVEVSMAVLQILRTQEVEEVIIQQEQVALVVE